MDSVENNVTLYIARDYDLYIVRGVVKKMKKEGRKRDSGDTNSASDGCIECGASCG